MNTPKPARETLWFILGMAFGTILAQRLASRRTNVPGRIAQLSAWERALAAKLGAQKAALLAAKVQARFENLYPGRPRFSHPALRMHLEARILPGIALYQILKAESDDQDAALAILDDCFAAHAMASAMGKQARLLDDLPGGFEILRLANRALLPVGFPRQGWQIDWVEDSPNCIAYDITGCFYMNVLSTYAVPELTAHFCVLDDLLYGNLKTIAWGRTGTLGRGDPRCNFVFRARIPQEAGELRQTNLN